METDAQPVDPAAEAGDDPAAGGALDTAAEETAEDLRLELEQALHKAEEYRDQALRAMAEAENVRRRSQKEIESKRKYAIESFVTELLPVKESLDQAAQVELDENAAEAVQKMAEGLALTLRQLDAVFRKFAVAEVAPEKGDPFDPELHQAMSLQPSDEVAPNEILAVVQKGYKLHDRLLRPAMVVVAKAPE